MIFLFAGGLLCLAFALWLYDARVSSLELQLQAMKLLLFELEDKTFELHEKVEEGILR